MAHASSSIISTNGAGQEPEVEPPEDKPADPAARQRGTPIGAGRASPEPPDRRRPAPGGFRSGARGVH